MNKISEGWCDENLNFEKDSPCDGFSGLFG